MFSWDALPLILLAVKSVKLLAFGLAPFVSVGSVEALGMPVPGPLSAIDRSCMSRSLPSVAWICLLPYLRGLLLIQIWMRSWASGFASIVEHAAVAFLQSDCGSSKHVPTFVVVLLNVKR
jgi:hypothetical protein